MKISDQMMEMFIGRELNESEQGTLKWLNGWDGQTLFNISKMIEASHEYGIKKGTKLMSKSPRSEPEWLTTAIGRGDVEGHEVPRK